MGEQGRPVAEGPEAELGDLKNAQRGRRRASLRQDRAPAVREFLLECWSGLVLVLAAEQAGLDAEAVLAQHPFAARLKTPKKRRSKKAA